MQMQCFEQDLNAQERQRMYCSVIADKSISDSLLNSETQASCYHLKRTHFKSSSFGLDRSVLRFLPMCIIASKFHYDNSSGV